MSELKDAVGVVVGGLVAAVLLVGLTFAAMALGGLFMGALGSVLMAMMVSLLFILPVAVISWVLQL